jgi:hypothetical protein
LWEEQAASTQPEWQRKKSVSTAVAAATTNQRRVSVGGLQYGDDQDAPPVVAKKDRRRSSRLTRFEFEELLNQVAAEERAGPNRFCRRVYKVKIITTTISRRCHMSITYLDTTGHLSHAFLPPYLCFCASEQHR